MKKIEQDLTDLLYRFNFIFKNVEVICECIDDFPEFTILEKSFGPFKRNKKYRLQFFIAEIFVERNVLKIDNKENLNYTDVQRYAIAESDDMRLTIQNNSYFFNKIKEFHTFTKKEVIDGKKHQKFLDNFNSYFASFLDTRLS
ncbi:MAG: hypothetical protein GF383_06055, partial [Candidatus Lokiarchaeota archaeon]|nr:hypothetical protein [Candidatus Lokiarchaeota archaeon]MBD3339506.1 hypothetical protein [Candidatus Lokiarchaeota archaeon]